MNSNTYTSYNLGLLDKIILSKRKSIYTTLSSLVNLNSVKKILDVGVTADQAFSASNFFESLYPHPERITAFSNQDASWMETIYPGLVFVQGDGCALPFASSSFDLVFSSAVIEHIGNTTRQQLFLSECNRVASNYVFLTTPNRGHPIEFHTLLPFLHWLPKEQHRHSLRLLRKKFFSKEENLNLLNERELSDMCNALGCTYQIKHIKLGGFVSNLLLFIKK